MSPELRPRVKIISNLKKEEIIERIKNKIDDPNTECSGWAKEGYALIGAPQNERHIWTPQLNLQIDESNEGTEVRGVIGPSSSVWTAFAFTFSILGFEAFVAYISWTITNEVMTIPLKISWGVSISFTSYTWCIYFFSQNVNS